MICLSLQDQPSNSNGYITADRLYDLNAMPPPMTTSLGSSKNHNIQHHVHDAVDGDNGGRRPVSGGGDPVTLLQYSAAYGNPHLRPNPAQWLPSQHLYARPEPPPYNSVRNGSGGTTENSGGGVVIVGKRKQQHQQQQKQHTAVNGNATAVPAGPNYHIGLAKRQTTLATHV